jgi:inorganic triphosphatase YgiF
LELVDDVSHLNKFHIFQKQTWIWFNRQQNRIKFEKLLKKGLYFKLSEEVQELERVVNQFESKEQWNRDNPQLRKKRLKLKKLSIQYKKNIKKRNFKSFFF